ncbi:MAG: lipase [Spirochaetes bacterium RBG_13_51_14]|nr:MAG: lipase [Spirochaetes bacterium RBG_13_51_14]
MKTKARESTLKTGDGIELFMSKSTVDRPAAAVVIVHGICEHSGRYDYVVSSLNKWGYSVYRFDNRGHGRSGGDKAFIDDFYLFIDDADRVVQTARNENPDIPIFMLGHSMGGLIAASYGVKHPDTLSGQILSGPAAIVLPAVKGLVNFDYNAQARSPIPNSLSNVISRDPKVVQAYADDPLVHKEFTMKLMGEVFIRGAQWLMDNMNSYAYPCLILHGGGDQIVTPDASRYLYEHISSTDKQMKIYDGLYHEILNEPERDTVLKDIHGWIEARIK